jgi:hypothetical protein
MSLELVVMPVVSLVTGVLSLFIDPNNKATKWQKPTMLTLLILTSVLTMLFGYQNSKQAQAEEAALKNSLAKLQERNDQLIDEMIELRKGVDTAPERTTEAFFIAFQERGWDINNLRSATQSQLDQSVEADKLIDSLASNINERQSITVQYFPKDVDPNIVRSRLEALGFTLTTPTTEVRNTPTNAIWFGSNVDIDSVKAVAYTLIAAGVELKMIRQLDNSQGRERVIQVGADASCVDNPTLTTEGIRNTQQFPTRVRDINPNTCQPT